MCLAIPTQVIEIISGGLATVELGGVTRQISLIMTPEAKVGDYTIIHAGFALNLLSEEDAQATIQTLNELADYIEAIDSSTES